MAELRKEADQEKISAAIAEQVALVGSQSLYERINNNFKKLKFEAFLAKVKLKISYCKGNYISFLTRNTLTCSAGGRSISTVSSPISPGSHTAAMTPTTTMSLSIRY